MNNKKPFGILVPNKIQKIIYNQEKIEYEKLYILATILRRFSVIISYYILNPLKIKPNHITILSIFLCFEIGYNFINGGFLMGSSLSCIWVLLDNIDGELARLQNKVSRLGSLLERLNSDVFYLVLFPSLGIGLFNIDLIEINFLIFSLICCFSFNILRSYIVNYPEYIKIRGTLSSFIKCQFKNSVKERKNNFFGNLVFYFWRNIFTQCGVCELILLLFSSSIFNLDRYLNFVFIFFIFGYFVISSIIILGVVFIALFD